ncbi:MAG: GNAT family N-acetyltransferase [Lachnospiraceae bacterium]|nr:GNAT family N-acetyltransferase [Lachnospiraceae bacterium]
MQKKYSDGNIYLRLMTLEDTEDIVRWRNQEEVRSNFIYQELFTVQSHERWVETMVKTGKVVQMVICEEETGKGIGSVYIRDIDHKHHKGEYGIFIGEPSGRGRGIGTAAAKLMLQYGFKELSLHKIFLRVFADNIQAIRSYEKAGFVQEAYLKDDVCIDGKYRDMLFMAVIGETKNEID